MRRPFSLLLIAVTVIMAGLISYASEQAATLQDGPPAADSPTPDPNVPTSTVTVTPTPEPDGVDTTPPQILSISIESPHVDTTKVSQTLTLTVHITDDLSGLGSAYLRFVPVMGGTQYIDFQMFADSYISGDRRDGIYIATATLPKYSAHGRWVLAETLVSDNAKNSQHAYGVPGGDAHNNREVEPIYFVNGKDSGMPTATVEPGLAPRDESPWSHELRMPLLGE